MGWFGTAQGHEGFVIGLVRSEEHGTEFVRGERHREVGTLADRERREDIEFLYFRVACECGWRSATLLGNGTYRPCYSELEYSIDEDRAERLWRRHHDDEEAR